MYMFFSHRVIGSAIALTGFLLSFKRLKLPCLVFCRLFVCVFVSFAHAYFIIGLQAVE
jgi:hypothetical protein